jgi:hypothetical protein
VWTRKLETNVNARDFSTLLLLILCSVLVLLPLWVHLRMSRLRSRLATAVLVAYSVPCLAVLIYLVMAAVLMLAPSFLESAYVPSDPTGALRPVFKFALVGVLIWAPIVLFYNLTKDRWVRCKSTDDEGRKRHTS